MTKIEQIKASVRGKLPNVYVLHGDLRDEEMNGLYNHPKVKAHVSFTHGEGFGRPLLEATLSGKPVIAPNWSGHVDFLDKSDAVLLPGSLNDVSKNSFPKNMIVQGQQWFTVNYNYASKMLVDVFNNYSKYKVKAQKLSIKNKTKFSLDAMTKKFEEILDGHLPKFEEQPQSVDLKLPKLKKVKSSSEKPKVELPKLKKVN
jgi:glycosyltransferase involved in cell wall biosynthesis